MDYIGAVVHVKKITIVQNEKSSRKMVGFSSSKIV